MLNYIQLRRNETPFATGHDYFVRGKNTRPGASDFIVEGHSKVKICKVTITLNHTFPVYIMELDTIITDFAETATGVRQFNEGIPV